MGARAAEMHLLCQRVFYRRAALCQWCGGNCLPSLTGKPSHTEKRMLLCGTLSWNASLKHTHLNSQNILNWNGPTMIISLVNGLYPISLALLASPSNQLSYSQWLIQYYLLLNLQSFHRWIFPFGTVSPEYMLCFVVRWKQLMGNYLLQFLMLLVYSMQILHGQSSEDSVSSKDTPLET